MYYVSALSHHQFNYFTPSGAGSIPANKNITVFYSVVETKVKASKQMDVICLATIRPLIAEN